MSQIDRLDQLALSTEVARLLNRWPTVGLAVGVVRDGSLGWFHGHGLADVDSGTPIDEDTVFRIDSITKTVTAIAVLQLWERGLVDLDAPADGYLRAYRMIPAKASFRPATVRHLLTHTAGVRAVRTAADLLRPTLGWGVRVGHRVPSLAEFYRAGLHVDVEPGTKWAYSNNGFATLGQIVEDVSGLPLGRYLRQRVFNPLGMEHSDLVRSQRVRTRLATGYTMRSRGLQRVTDREMVTAGAGSVYSSTGDMARYVAALLGRGSNEHGAVLEPETLARMFEPHYQPDPRIPGMGLGFYLDEIGGHRTVGHDGIWTGFHSAMAVAPDDGIGVVAFANTGGFSPLAVAAPVANTVLRLLLHLPEDTVRTDVPQRPWSWNDLCGWYTLGPGVLVDPQPRMLGPGVEVVARRDHLAVRVPIPVPALRQGLRLHPDGDDPDAFRINLPGYGSGTSRIVFSRRPDGAVTALHLGVQPLTFHKRPNAENPRPWATAALAAAAALAVHRRTRRTR